LLAILPARESAKQKDTKTMKALTYSEHGSPSVLTFTDVADPAFGKGDALIRVRATGVNRVDVAQRNGWFTLPNFSLPNIPGMDVAGEIVALGEEAAQIANSRGLAIAIGDRVVVDPSMSEVPASSSLHGNGDLYGNLDVIGATVAGGYAELCVAPVSHIHLMPEAMSFAHAAAFPTAWMTAHHALFDVGNLRAGETLLVHAGASGVSLAAIQLARAAGVDVYATASSEGKCQRAVQAGATAAVTNRTTDIAQWSKEQTNGRGVDMVFDHVGAALWAPSMFALAPRGRLINCGNTSGDEATIPSLGFMFHMGIQILGSDPYRYEEFAEVWQTYCSQDFDSSIDTTYQLQDGAEAHRRLESNDIAGKFILIP
jgi:NADPH:quinone reductase-like Zn-dependent oxidoreductase